jgi:transglutaminase-like putative cysteine protease
MATAIDFLSTYIEPLAEDLTLHQAERILAIKPTDKLTARVLELAGKSSGGALTEYERAEYEYYVDVDDVIGILKTKARSILGRPTD